MTRADLLTRLGSDRGGSIPIIFAAVTIALMTSIAAVVSYGQLSQARTNLDGLADAAVLAAVSRPSIDGTLTDAQQIDASKKIATDWFKSQVPTNVALQSVDVVVTKSGSTLTATLTYSGTMQSSFGSLLMPTIAVGGTASSSFTSAYMNILVLVDTSQSMGLGADLATQTKMTSDPKVNWCALACHGNPGDVDTVKAAHTAGYKLRIDVVKDALAKVIADAQATAAQTKATIKIGIYSIDDGFHTVKALTNDYAGLSTAASSLDIAHYDAGSSLSYGLNQVKALVGTPGDGSSATKPLTFVMFLSDGLNNTVDNKSTGSWEPATTAYPAYTGKTCWTQTPPPDAGPTWYAPTGEPAALPCVPDPYTSKHMGNGQMEMMPIDPTWCQPLKATGVRLMTLYTEYVLLPDASTNTNSQVTNDWRLPLIKSKIKPKLQTNMAACASKTTDAYVANDTASINAGIDAMFSTAMASAARLTK